MPRERVEAMADPWQPVVGWSHQGGVQVATVAEGERSIYWLLLGSGSEALGKLGEQVRALELVAYDDDETRARALLNTLDVITPTSGLWADLDRRGCNDLIRLLRKARDAAFGRDE